MGVLWLPKRPTANMHWWEPNTTAVTMSASVSVCVCVQQNAVPTRLVSNPEESKIEREREREREKGDATLFGVIHLLPVLLLNSLYTTPQSHLSILHWWVVVHHFLHRMDRKERDQRNTTPKTTKHKLVSGRKRHFSFRTKCEASAFKVQQHVTRSHPI